MMDTGTILTWTIEVLVFAVVIYAFVRFLQETRGSAVLKGFIFLFLLLGVGFVAIVRQFGLAHLEYIADQGLFIILIGLVVVFQPELRQVLVKLGEAKLFHRLTAESRVVRSVTDEIVQAAERLSRRGLGAIILVERSVGIGGFTEGGVILDAHVSAPLLVTIFFKDTPLHDGAVIIRRNRVVAAGCLLPLSQNPNLPERLGTRHRAAVGSTEENDAIAIVVSEETQRISAAVRGRMEEGVTPDRLHEILAHGAEEVRPSAARAGVA
jgi:diadenylate cyclase